MKFIKYLSEGNSVGLENDIESYWEIDVNGYITRSIDIIKNGDLLKYSASHSADSFGQLPEGKVSEVNLNDQSFGKCLNISTEEFESIWLLKSINHDSNYNKDN